MTRRRFLRACTAKYWALIGAVGLGAIGGLAGFIAGGLRGHHDELDFTPPR